MSREQYERDLKERQQKHLNEVQGGDNWQPCLHDECYICHGTGIGKFGPCLHAILCPCPKCTLSYGVN